MRVSVALCTYNGGSYLRAQLESLAAQTRLPDELVVCDDRSADDTIAIVERFAAVAPFRVRLHVNESNLGSTRNFERAVGLCDGDVITLADQDDYWLPEKLARVERAFAEAPDVGLVTGDAWLATNELGSTGSRLWANLPFTPAMQDRFNRGEAFRLLLRYNLVTGATTAFRAALRPVLLPIPACWVHDGWIGLLAAALAPVRAVPEPFILYRQHTAQQIGVVKLSFWRQFHTARNMDEAYFARLTACFESLLDRLTAHKNRLASPEVLRHLGQKVALSRQQLRMRRTNRAKRAWMAAGELARLRYHRYARGFKSWLADSFL